MIFLFILTNYFEYIAIHWEYWAAHIWYLFGDEEQSDGEYLFCIVYVLMMAVYGLVFKLLLK